MAATEATRRREEPEPTRLLVSFVIPIFNGANYIGKTLASIQRQTCPEWEAIVVDGGSTDGTAAIVENAVGRDERIRLIVAPGSGIAEACNIGASAARGSYLARLDADDIAVPSRISKQREYLEANPDVAVVGGQFFEVDASGAPFHPTRISAQPVGVAGVMASLPTRCVICNSTATMRREAFDRVGGYRTAFVGSEDYDLWLRISDSNKLDNLPDVLVNYRIHSGSVSFTRLFDSVVGAEVARRCARRRRQGREDPVSSRGAIDDEVLNELGLGREGAVIISFEGFQSLSSQWLIRGSIAAAEAAAAECRRIAREIASNQDLAAETLIIEIRLAIATGDGRRFVRSLWDYRSVVPRACTRALQKLARRFRPPDGD